MSATLDDLLIRKTGVSLGYKKFKDYFGLSLESCPMLMPTEVKEPYTTEYKDEHGVDSYNQSEAFFKSFDATFKFVAVTESTTDSHDIVKSVIDYVTNDGTLHDIYSPWAGVGRKKCRFKSLGDFNQHMNKSNEFVVQFSMTFTIEDPDTELEESDFKSSAR